VISAFLIFSVPSIGSCCVEFLLPSRFFQRNAQLITAVEEGNLKGVESLISSGANVNARDSEGLTALMIAAEYWYPEIVQALINAGADVNARDQLLGGKTALWYAESSPWNLNRSLDSGSHPHPHPHRNMDPDLDLIQIIKQAQESQREQGLGSRLMRWLRGSPRNPLNPLNPEVQTP